MANRQGSLEIMVNLRQAFEGKRVWLSGHTGFKGSWLSEWLLDLGAIVHGYALVPDTIPSLFDQLGLAGRLEHEVSDIRDAEAVRNSINAFRPDFVIHMAAQPLVRRSYAIPVETYATNVMGTVHVLEALRAESNHCAAVIITTDKVYQNHESGRAYEESDRLGGHDPYSSSKAMAEIATTAYRDSYFQSGAVQVASARAGNVIGGGDWAEDRIVPDAMRALNNGDDIQVRNPNSVRPWQHVLEPLGGYLQLVASLALNPAMATSLNFGPGSEANRSVRDLTKEILIHRQGSWTDASDPKALHEANLLNLSIEKAGRVLNWIPRWDFATTVEKTVSWYRDIHDGIVTPTEMTISQIHEYDRLIATNNP
jgi:CDP-glucose 4,6-dehydratase